MQSSKLSFGESVPFFLKLLKASITLTSETCESISFEYLAKSRTGVSPQEELNHVELSQMMLCGLKSVLALVQSATFGQLIFKHYHLRKYKARKRGTPDKDEKEEYVLNTDLFRKLFKSLLQFSLEKSPINAKVEIADFERCLSVLFCKAVHSVEEGNGGKCEKLWLCLEF